MYVDLPRWSQAVSTTALLHTQLLREPASAARGRRDHVHQSSKEIAEIRQQVAERGRAIPPRAGHTDLLEYDTDVLCHDSSSATATR